MAPTKSELVRIQIRQWIDSTGITQVALAERIGRNQAWMSRYLKGEFDTDLETLEAMTRVFGHTLAAALNVPDEPDEAGLVTKYRAATPEQRRLVHQILDEWTRPKRKRRAPSRR